MSRSLGVYNILDTIGTGGIGEVYRARDTRHGRTVAIKVVAASIASDPARREQFLADARAAAALSHPNIADLYEVGEEQGVPYLVFEFIPGDPLNRVIGGRPMNPRRALHLAIQIADALADAHAAGIAHLDLKPANVIVTPKGNAKILDFGLSRWTSGGVERERAAAAGPATPAAALATAAYMSPEQALGERGDHRTDLFSLGAMLYEMLAGKPPFSGTPAAPLPIQIVQATPPAPSTVNRALPPDVDSITSRALAKSLDQRYESAAAMAAELRSVAAILDVRSERTDAERPPAFVPPPRGHKRPVVGLIVLLIVVAALAALAWFGRGALAGLL